MSEEGTFWLKIWKYSTVILCVLIVGGFSSCQLTRYQIRKMAETHDPIKATCALHYGMNYGDSAVCGMASQK